MTRILALILFAAVSLAADATGRWTGTFTVMGGDGHGNPGTALLILKQEGNVLTGTAGPNEDDQKNIRNGKVDGDVITFTLEPHEGGAVMSFTLKQSGDEISGDINGEREGQRMSAKLAVKREK